jgi:hypothetical protein
VRALKKKKEEKEANGNDLGISMVSKNENGK